MALVTDQNRKRKCENMPNEYLKKKKINKKEGT